MFASEFKNKNMDFELKKFKPQKYYGLFGNSIPEERVKVGDEVVNIGDILTPLGFKSDIMLIKLHGGYGIVSDQSDQYVTGEQLRNITFTRDSQKHSDAF